MMLICFVASYVLILASSFRLNPSPTDLQIIDSLLAGFLYDVTLEDGKVCPEKYEVLLQFEE